MSEVLVKKQTGNYPLLNSTGRIQQSEAVREISPAEPERAAEIEPNTTVNPR